MRVPFALLAAAAGAAIHLVSGSAALAASHAECVKRLALARQENPSASQLLAPGSEREKAVLDFCLQDVPPEGLDCAFGNLRQGGNLAREPHASIALCNTGWSAPRECMAEVYQQGASENLLTVSEICGVKDTEQRQCVVTEAVKRKGKGVTMFKLVDSCAAKEPALRACMLDYVDSKSPFDVAQMGVPADARDFCGHWIPELPEVRACLLNYYKNAPPFGGGPKLDEGQAQIVCGFSDPQAQLCLLEGVRKGDRAQISTCLYAKPSTDLERRTCEIYMTKQVQSERDAISICSFGNIELRRCIVGRVLSGQGFIPADMHCSWVSVARLLEASPRDRCPP